MSEGGASSRLGLAGLEPAVARIGQAAGAGGALLSTGIAGLVDLGTGLVLLGISIATTLFYTSLLALLSSRPEEERLRWLAPAYEALLPPLVLGLSILLEGPTAAFGSWIPPLLAAGLTAGSILRLEPWLPVSTGAFGAAAYLATWAAASGPGDAPHPSIPAVGLLFCGGVSSLLVLQVREEIAQASRRLEDRALPARYRLGSDIASGGMGRVIDAVYLPGSGFRRRVAIKLLHPHLAADPAYVDRFRTEAELAACLAHPNIVATLDFGRMDETWFLAMEFVEGRTLMAVLNERRRLERPLPLRIVAWLGRQLAEGLDHAHARASAEDGRPLRIVHRDLSPSNILVDRSGRVRIIDFGVARALRAEPRIPTRHLVGKPAYLAPETLNEQIVDEQIDLWSLGVVLWEAVANQRLFARENDAAALLAVSDAQIPPLSELRPGLADGWVALFERMLARDRAARLSSAAEVRDALDAILSADGPVTGEDLRELLATEEELEEIDLDDTSEELPGPVTVVPPVPELDDKPSAPLEAAEAPLTAEGPRLITEAVEAAPAATEPPAEPPRTGEPPASEGSG